MGNKQSTKGDQEYANGNRSVVSGDGIQGNQLDVASASFETQNDGRQTVNTNGDNQGSAKPNIQQDAAMKGESVNAHRNLTQVNANKRKILNETIGERKRLMKQRRQLNDKMKEMSSNLQSLNQMINEKAVQIAALEGQISDDEEM
jgi:predicted  nucleic acid-binding Zn-ribbon protein